MLPPITIASPKELRSMMIPARQDDDAKVERAPRGHIDATAENAAHESGQRDGTEGQVTLQFLRQAALHGEQCRLRAIFELQLRQNGADIALHGAFREVQLVADLP